jgi:hypothetical protein
MLHSCWLLASVARNILSISSIKLTFQTNDDEVSQRAVFIGTKLN